MLEGGGSVDEEFYESCGEESDEIIPEGIARA